MTIDFIDTFLDGLVSMKSGLEGRNNTSWLGLWNRLPKGLNEVRPRRPEQCARV